MKIGETKLIDILDGRVQYRIPIFQRKYDWEQNDCRKLLSDIIDIADDSKRRQHFVGSIIYKADSEALLEGTVRINYLIDGQQRLTTIMLILLAVSRYAQELMPPEVYENSGYSFDAIKDDYLTNNNRFANTEFYYKLRPIGDDDSSFQALINDTQLPEQVNNSRIYDNYSSILSDLKRRQIDPQKVMQGIGKLLIANIVLERDDNAQLLFETVNSTGKSLKDVDKVRNYVLMNAGESLQKELFKNYWEPMEQSLNIINDGGKTLNQFFFYYAEIITETKIPVNYYDKFKDHFLGISAEDIKNAVIDMSAYSAHYKRWLDSSALSNKVTDILLFRLKLTGNDNCIPVVLKVLRNVETSKMTEEDANEALKILESYIIRREMYDLKSHSIGEAFIKILRCANSLSQMKECIINDLTEKQRMPADDELKIKLHTVEFYGLKHDHYILDRIEKSLNREYMPDHNVINIEHIMPQTIVSSSELFTNPRYSNYTQQDKENRDWAKDLGDNWKEIHQKYCNTLGNLTLAGIEYNTKYGNCRFIVKRDMRESDENGYIFGYAASPIRLSQSLRNKDKWGEEEIIERSDNIFKIIKKIWPFPKLESEN